MKSMTITKLSSVYLAIILLWVSIVSCTPKSEAKPAEIVDYKEYAIKVADSFLARNSDFIITYNEDRSKHKWHYEQGLMLKTLHELYQRTDDSKYLQFIKNNLDLYVDSLGQISTYKPKTYKLDDVTPARALLSMYHESGENRYLLAADQIYDQLLEQPRTNEGGFWHKKIYPYQMWLDGLYMAGPYSAEYAVLKNHPEEYEDIINQFVWAYSHLYDDSTGLLYHGWDESRQQEWADPETGLSKSFWSRGMGWYMMALVDVLEIVPEDYQSRHLLIEQLQSLSLSVLNYRDPCSKLWYQVTDQQDREGNYLEASASAMFIYAMSKGVNHGWIDPGYGMHASESFSKYLKQFVVTEPDGLISIHQTCSSAGLGGKQKRDGSYAYYLSEPKRSNDCKAIGPFILAALELEKGQIKND